MFSQTLAIMSLNFPAFPLAISQLQQPKYTVLNPKTWNNEVDAVYLKYCSGNEGAVGQLVPATLTDTQTSK